MNEKYLKFLKINNRWFWKLKKKNTVRQNLGNEYYIYKKYKLFKLNSFRFQYF